jgi:hypothetical protein
MQNLWGNLDFSFLSFREMFYITRCFVDMDGFHCFLFIMESVIVLSVALFALVCVWNLLYIAEVYCRFEAGQLLQTYM